MPNGFFPPYADPRVGMGPDQGPLGPGDFDVPYAADVGAAGYPENLSPHERFRLQQIQQGTAMPEASPGAPRKPVMQPGNRRTISEYLEQIKQMQAQGQDVVPTFTNIRGGPLDVAQGQLAGQDVRSYMTPEYREVPGAMGELERGPAHPVSRAAAGMQAAGGRRSMFDADWANQRATDDLPELFEMARQQDPGMTPEKFERVANAHRANLAKQQSEYVSSTLKKMDGYSVESVMDAFKSGDMAKLRKAQNDFFSREFQNKYMQDLNEEFRKAINKGEQPQNPEDGEVFTSPNEYVNYYLKEFYENLQEIMQAAAMQSGLEGGAIPSRPAGARNEARGTPKDYYLSLRQKGMSAEKARQETTKKFS